MLNTDLHNPNMDDAKRMTLEQFIRNNRGINDGADLPVEFLEELYMDIKHNEIQMKKDISYDSIDDFDGLLVERGNITTPFIASSNTTSNFCHAGVHERDMFVSISMPATRAMASVFVQSWDDALVMKALNGLRSSARICAYFGLVEELNEIASLLLGWGQDYVESVAKLRNTEAELAHDIKQNKDSLSVLCADDKLDIESINAELASSDLPPLPVAFVTSLYLEGSTDQIHPLGADDVAGAAAHRGLLSLHYALLLSKNHLTILGDDALRLLLEVIFSLRDVDALPPRLNDLDDFADSKGNPLPLSMFAMQSLERMNTYKVALSATSRPPSNSGFMSMFSFSASQPELKAADMSNPLIKVLKTVSDTACIDQIIMKMGDLRVVKRILSSMLSVMFPDDHELIQELCLDPTYEHNAVFVLELAARLLISNRSHSASLMPIFVRKFEVLFSSCEGGDILGLQFPYLLERCVVTILRACIHLYDISDRSLRTHLVRSMDFISRLPSTYTKEISSRLGCGSAIVLRGCFLFFDGSREWSAIRNLLDLAAQHEAGRPFVFDGVASLVEYAFPNQVDGQHAETNDVDLSSDGCEALRYLLLKFLEGSYDNDLNYKVPSMMLMKRVYSRQNSCSDLSTSDLGRDSQDLEFTNMVSVIYNDVCMSDNLKASKKGYESLNEILLSTKVESIPDDQWLTLMHMACKTPPPVIQQSSRIDSLGLIGRLFLILIPELSNRKENWAQLEDFTLDVARQIGENLRSGRSTPLFEMTVQNVSNMCNVMSMSGFNDGQGIDFCSWVGDTLLCELEKVGATGGVSSV
jgi:hypothetical protein